MRTLPSLLLSVSLAVCSQTDKQPKTLSLFSIVQFPNSECTASSSSSTFGTCVTSSECTSRGGSTDGNCAVGFGVCCVVSTSTCGSTISTNTTYIRNSGYPSSYTATAGICKYTINKVSDDICQLRLDFQTFSGFVVGSATGACTDTLAVAGQTGSNPPSICGTNTGYHMYAEIGASSTDSASITLTYATGGVGTVKNFNILVRQISCTATWKAPDDCTQYFTGVSGNVQSFSYGQFLQSQYYTSCVRTEQGHCAIQWKQSSTTSPDPFGITSTDFLACPSGYVAIPGLSMDGSAGIPVPLGLQTFQSIMCGTDFGVNTSPSATTAAALVSRVQPFIIGVYSDTTTSQALTGFNLDYTQIPC